MTRRDAYSEDEVRAIIDLALHDRQGRELTHEELLAVGSEIGLSSEAVESAARAVLHEREGDAVKQRILSRRRRYLGFHSSTYLVINGFLFAVNYLTTPGQWWALFPIVLWGIVLVLHAFAALWSDPSEGAIEREKRRTRIERHVRADVERDLANRVRLAPPSENEGAIDEADVAEPNRRESEPSRRGT